MSDMGVGSVVAKLKGFNTIIEVLRYTTDPDIIESVGGDYVVHVRIGTLNGVKLSQFTLTAEQAEDLAVALQYVARGLDKK